jgi:hypothetical protein
MSTQSFRFVSLCYPLPHPVSAADVQPYEILARVLEIGEGAASSTTHVACFQHQNLTDGVE